MDYSKKTLAKYKSVYRIDDMECHRGGNPLPRMNARIQQQHWFWCAILGSIAQLKKDVGMIPLKLDGPLSWPIRDPRMFCQCWKNWQIGGWHWPEFANIGQSEYIIGLR